MNEFFIPLDLSKKFKEFGFDGDCFGYWENNTLDPECPKLIINFNNLQLTDEQQKRPGLYKTGYKNSSLAQWAIAAPLIDDAVEWLEMNHKIKITAEHQDLNGMWYSYIWIFSEPNDVGKWEKMNIVQSFQHRREAILNSIDQVFKKGLIKML